MAWDRIIYNGSTVTEFIGLDGTPTGREPRLMELERDGVDGNAWMLLDYKSKPFTIFGEVDVVGVFNARVLEMTTYPAIPGKLCQIYQNGLVWPGYFLCLRYEPAGAFKLASTGGGGVNNGDWIVRSRWEFQYSGT